MKGHGTSDEDIHLPGAPHCRNLRGLRHINDDRVWKCMYTLLIVCISKLNQTLNYFMPRLVVSSAIAICNPPPGVSALSSGQWLSPKNRKRKPNQTVNYFTIWSVVVSSCV